MPHKTQTTLWSYSMILMEKPGIYGYKDLEIDENTPPLKSCVRESCIESKVKSQCNRTVADMVFEDPRICSILTVKCAYAGVPPPTYFVDHKRGEVNELRGLLRNPKVTRDPEKQRDVTKKVIAYMTLGIDMSKLFSEMINLSHTKDLVIKKMIYLYLCSYATKKKDLAVLAINTLRKDAQDDDPMIRGLALRSLCSLKLPTIVEYVVPLLRSGIKDSSSYVRKTAAMGLARLYRISPETYNAGRWTQALHSMLTDREPAVAINALNTLNEVEEENGGVKPEAKTVVPLLKRVREFNEWNQCTILALAATYQPSNQQEMFGIMNHLDPLLKHSNCAVVLATTKVYLNFTRNLPKVHFSVIQRLKVPLLTLMSSSSEELSFTVISHLKILVSRAPDIFADDHKHFYCRYNDPACIKKIKQDVLVEIGSGKNASELINELSEYITVCGGVADWRELLTATMKLFFKRPPELQKMLGRLLDQAISDSNQVDVRDQALFYYRLLRHDPHEAARIVNCEKVKQTTAEVKKTVPPPAIDILASLADDTPVVVDNGGNQQQQQQALTPKPKLAPQLYKKKWGALPKTTVLTAVLKTPVPGVKQIVALFRKNHIDTVASGAKGGLMKFYFYAQSAKDSSFFLVEANLHIESGKYAATIKCENKALLSDFEGAMKGVLATIS
eukprot:jgi/Bigna1/88218/estExt_fgenesh1_pg.C_290095